MTPRNMGRISGLAVLMASVAAPAFAGSFYLQEQSVRGAGRAYSGEAADRGVGSMWWNPAAIARSGREVSVGMHGIRIDSEVKNNGSYVTYPGGADVPVVNPRNTTVDPIESGLVPNFAFATPVGDRFAV
ncbi:MAG TPA: outer membrane protein transport protein, partial [Brevundimonas sp.]|nr:outer membrane protein transport protein [Brevundimonas sp.]